MSRTKKQTRKQSSMYDHVFTSLVKRAFRKHSLLAAGGPGFVAMFTPEGYKISEFQKHVVREVYGDDSYFKRDDIHIAFMKLQGDNSEILDDYNTHFASKSRVVVLVEHGVELPPLIRLACDGVIEIDPISANDLKAASLAVLRRPMSDQQATKLQTYPREYMWAAMRDGRSLEDTLSRLQRTPIPVKEDVKTKEGPERDDDTLRLGQMYGYGPAREWGLELAQDIRDWSDGTISWNEIDRGIVLSGPPGVGKTVFAKALAKECNIHLLASSLGKWQSQGHLGDLLKAMRNDFTRARAKSPCIFFIDEIDAFGSREAFSSDNRDYSVQVVNAFLELLDGIDGREGIIIVGATNEIARIDPAILRSGRLDKHVNIPLPSLTDRVAILSQLLGASLATAELESLGPVTRGMTGADLSKAVRDAKRYARRQRRQLSLNDLEAAMPRTFKIEGDHRRTIAVHEAGHTLVGLKLRAGKFLGSFIANQIVVGTTTQQAGGAYFEHPTYGLRGRQYFLDQIAVMLAGIASEKLCYGEIFEGAGGERSSDLAAATRIATLMEVSMGMGSSLSYSHAKDDSELELVRRAEPSLAVAVDKTLSEQFQRATDILRQHRGCLNVIASILEKHSTFSKEEGEQILTALDSAEIDVLV